MKTTDLRDIIEHYKRGEGGRHWFDADTMRFFNCRLPDLAYTMDDGAHSYFVTSERYDSNAPRLFTVRHYNWATREIDTIDGFQSYASRSTATTRAKNLAIGWS